MANHKDSNTMLLFWLAVRRPFLREIKLVRTFRDIRRKFSPVSSNSVVSSVQILHEDFLSLLSRLFKLDMMMQQSRLLLIINRKSHIVDLL